MTEIGDYNITDRKDEKRLENGSRKTTIDVDDLNTKAGKATQHRGKRDMERENRIAEISSRNRHTKNSGERLTIRVIDRKP